jgi:hypothetical protein
VSVAVAAGAGAPLKATTTPAHDAAPDRLHPAALLPSADAARYASTWRSGGEVPAFGGVFSAANPPVGPLETLWKPTVPTPPTRTSPLRTLPTVPVEGDASLPKLLV